VPKASLDAIASEVRRAHAARVLVANGNIKRGQAQLDLAILARNPAARLRARNRNLACHGRSQSYPKVRCIRLRGLFHRYKQGASTAVVQHAELRQSRKTKALAFGGGLRRHIGTACRSHVPDQQLRLNNGNSPGRPSVRPVAIDPTRTSCLRCPRQKGQQPSQLFAVGKNLFYFRLCRDQLFTFRGPDRQLYLFAAAVGRNRRGNAISVFRVGCHGVVEQYRVAAFQRYAQRRGRFDTEELKD